MAWSDIDEYDVRQLMDASAMASLKDDINYLLAPNAATYHHPGTGANYTTTGLGEDLDATNFNLSIVTGGGLVMGMFYGQFKTSVAGNTVRATIVHVDPISYIGRNLFWDYTIETASGDTNGEPRGWVQYFPGLPAGTHQFKVVWGIGGGATGTLLVGWRPRFSVVEK